MGHMTFIHIWIDNKTKDKTRFVHHASNGQSSYAEKLSPESPLWLVVISSIMVLAISHACIPGTQTLVVDIGVPEDICVTPPPCSWPPWPPYELTPPPDVGLWRRLRSCWGETAGPGLWGPWDSLAASWDRGTGGCEVGDSKEDIVEDREDITTLEAAEEMATEESAELNKTTINTNKLRRNQE